MAKATTPKKTVKKTTVVKKATVDKMEKGFELAVFDQKGVTQKSRSVAAVFMETKVPTSLLTQATRVYQSAQRQGTQSTKTRGQVQGSTRKIYRQKGTGRARHGDIKAPIFVGGGIVFGPKPRNFTLDLPKNMRRKALVGLMAEKMKVHQVHLISDLGTQSGKTKDIVSLLKAIDMNNRPTLLIVDPNMKAAIRASRNIESVTVRPVHSFSFYDVLHSDNVLFATEAFETWQKQVTE